MAAEAKQEDKKAQFKTHEFKDIQGLETELDSCKDSKRIFLLFCGNEKDGKSWCPDCVAAKPIIEKNYEYLKAGDTFITVFVGDLPTWKNKQHPLRIDDKFKVTGVPTLFLYKSQQRLVEPQCADTNLVKMLFEGDDDE